MLLTQQLCMVTACKTLIGNRILEVEPAGRISGSIGNEAVAGANSQAIARWLHYRYASIELRGVDPYGTGGTCPPNIYEGVTSMVIPPIF